MKIIDQRLHKLEDRFGRANGRPRRCLRMMISMAGAKPSLEDATCRRTLWSDGTLFEMVEFRKHNAGRDELTDEELDRWLESFPVD
jgi:hypothetical protein